MEDLTNFFRPFREETFDDESCFLCGEYCEEKTAEHIFPKWLQHRFNLWDQRLTLSNNTTIPYRNLTVPCCSKCNNEHLSAMEERFQSLLDRSFRDLDYQDELVVFQWTAKVLYATLYKELSLLVDRKKPDLGKILSPAALEGYSSLHVFLQSIRLPTEFKNPKPWSLFVFNCLDKEFYYFNDIHSLCFSMKFGEVAITIVYEDNNLIEAFMHGFKRIGNYQLNFPQYIEVNAHIFYGAKLKTSVPKYVTTYSETAGQLTVHTLNSPSSRGWVTREFAVFFDHLLNKAGEYIGASVLQDDGNLTSFLVDENGEHITKKLFEEE